MCVWGAELGPPQAATSAVAAARPSSQRRAPTNPLLRRRQARALHVRPADAIVGDAFLDLAAEVAEEALDRPDRRVGELADGVALDLAGHVQQHVDLARLGLAGD